MLQFMRSIIKEIRKCALNEELLAGREPRTAGNFITLKAVIYLP
jgi:hypothetical protein